MGQSLQLHRIIDQTNPCFTSLSADTGLDQVVTALARYGKTAVVILENGKPAGILTRTDIVRYLDQDGCGAGQKKSLSQVMTRELVLSDPQTPFDLALQRMAKFNIEHLLVIQEGRLVTVIHEKELLRFRLKTLQADIDEMQEYIENLHNATQD